jgi:hypothetical protein
LTENLFFFFLQPYPTFNNEQVWLHVEAGGHMEKPTMCPGLLFSGVIEPCFNPEPLCRPTFYALCDIFGVLNSTSFLSELEETDRNFPRLEFDQKGNETDGHAVQNTTENNSDTMRNENLQPNDFENGSPELISSTLVR